MERPIAENSSATTVSAPQGLCADCAYARRVESARGSQFLLCERSRTDAAYPKYPRLPVIECAGYERSLEDAEPHD